MTRRLGQHTHTADDGANPPLPAVCELARWSHGAVAVSVAVITDAGLTYVAASGEGADAIVGTGLRAGEGLAGFVAATGQSLAVRDAQVDPRFARNVAERTGYVPDAMQIVPIHDPDGEVIAVMSMLDRGHHDAPADAPVALAGFAEIAASMLPAPVDADLAGRLARIPSPQRDGALAALTAVLDAIEQRPVPA